MFPQTSLALTTVTSHAGQNSSNLHDLVAPGSSATSSVGSINPSASSVAAAAIVQASHVMQQANTATASHSPSPRYFLCMFDMRNYIHITLKLVLAKYVLYFIFPF